MIDPVGNEELALADSGRAHLEGAATPQPSTMARSLDMADADDRALIRRSTGHGRHSRWPVPEDMKQDVVTALRAALALAREQADFAAVNDICRTIVVIEGQNQADDHQDEKFRRIDNKQGTEQIVLVDDLTRGR
jgi:Mg2+/Co2+ transporter CorC